VCAWWCRCSLGGACSQEQHADAVRSLLYGAGTEQYCGSFVLTYNSEDKDGSVTQGGYSTHIVVTQE
jgi:hypothetical protein